MTITPGLDYRHKETDRRYTVIDRCKVKCGDDWVDGVIYERYIPMRHRNSELYARPVSEFEEKFERWQG
jgi:hypothetical protein